MTTKRVLLTGARGFVGRHCIDPLLSRGYEVHCVSSSAEPRSRAGVVWHTANLLDPDQARSLAAKVTPSHALHLAWTTIPGQYWTSPENECWRTSSEMLFQALADNGCARVVGAGTCAEYDWTQGHCDETQTRCRPSTPYGISKHALSVSLDRIAKAAGMGAAWGRVFYLYGPWEHRARLVPSVILSLLNDRRARCSAGTQVRDFLFVGDVASAFAALVDSDIAGAVNIASGAPTTVRALVLEIAHQLDRSNLVDFGAPVAEPERLTAATSRLFDEVGWRPQSTLQTGIAETIAWWKACASQEVS